MRKIIILLFVFICCLTSCSNQSIATDKTEKANSPEPVCNATYQLFPTQNMWTFIKLNTRDGRMWQVQYDIKGSERFEVNLNTAPFATKEEERDGRFTLYPTQNMWTFILLDQIDGRMWQVQWSMKEDSRFVIQIENKSSRPLISLELYSCPVLSYW